MSRRRDSEVPNRRTIEIRSEWVWPLAIIVALLITAAVNAAFIYIAVTGADDVVPSYFTEER